MLEAVFTMLIEHVLGRYSLIRNHPLDTTQLGIKLGRVYRLFEIEAHIPSAKRSSVRYRSVVCSVIEGPRGIVQRGHGSKRL